MSATYPLRKAAPAKPGRSSAPAARPRLVVISSPRHTVARGPFIVLVGVLLIGGLLALLMLHTLAAQDAFRQTTLQQKLATLTDTEQQLEQQVQTDSAPAALEARAAALGMVPSTITSYRRRPDGRTVAHEVPASSVVAPTSTTPSASTATTTTGTASSTTASTTASSTTTSSTTVPSKTTSAPSTSSTTTSSKTAPTQSASTPTTAASTGPTTVPTRHVGPRRP